MMEGSRTFAREGRRLRSFSEAFGGHPQQLADRIHSLPFPASVTTSTTTRREHTRPGVTRAKSDRFARFGSWSRSTHGGAGMSGYHLPSALPTPYDLPLPVGVESPRRGPIPLTSTEHNLQQPFENWSLRAPYELPGSSTAAGPYRTDSVMQNEFAYHPPIPQPRPQATPNGGQPASGWGLPRGAMLHVPPGIPDEMLPKQIAPGSELVKVTGKVRARFSLSRCRSPRSFFACHARPSQSCASCRARKVKVS